LQTGKTRGLSPPGFPTHGEAIMTFFQALLKLRRRVIFRKPKGCIGMCEVDRIYVALRPRRLSPAQVYLHELIHQYLPDYSEQQVLYAERYLWKRLTNQERYLLYRKLFRHPYNSEERSERRRVRK
jgi:hypothetical protein